MWLVSLFFCPSSSVVVVVAAVACCFFVFFFQLVIVVECSSVRHFLQVSLFSRGEHTHLLLFLAFISPSSSCFCCCFNGEMDLSLHHGNGRRRLLRRLLPSSPDHNQRNARASTTPDAENGDRSVVAVGMEKVGEKEEEEEEHDRLNHGRQRRTPQGVADAADVVVAVDGVAAAAALFALRAVRVLRFCDHHCCSCCCSCCCCGCCVVAGCCCCCCSSSRCLQEIKQEALVQPSSQR